MSLIGVHARLHGHTVAVLGGMFHQTMLCDALLMEVSHAQRAARA
jgi:hypothetical protein